MKKYLMILPIALLLFSCQTGTQVEENKQPSVSPTATAQSYTLEEIAKHASPDNCWTAINDKVYDVTKFIAAGKHNPTILEGCGKDGTVLFSTRPMGSKTDHSDTAKAMLAEYYIGKLAK